jgi:ankyrin repeat protein
VDGDGAVEVAARHGQCAVVKLLLRHASTASLNAALFAAAEQGRTDICLLLLEQGNAEFNARNTEGYSAWFLAVYSGRTHTVRALANYYCDSRTEQKQTGIDLVNSRDAYRNTPLHMAAMAGHTDTVQLLLELGADTAALDKYGETAAYYAVERRNTQCARAIRNFSALTFARLTRRQRDAHVPGSWTDSMLFDINLVGEITAFLISV